MLDGRLSVEAAHHFARVYGAARAGCLSELRRAGCTEEEAEEIFAATFERIMRRRDPPREGFSVAQTVALLKRACRQKLTDERRHRDVLKLVPLKEAASRADPGDEPRRGGREARGGRDRPRGALGNSRARPQGLPAAPPPRPLARGGAVPQSRPQPAHLPQAPAARPLADARGLRADRGRHALRRDARRAPAPLCGPGGRRGRVARGAGPSASLSRVPLRGGADARRPARLRRGPAGAVRHRP